MTFVRAKTIKGRQYFYLVENVRDGKKTRQKVIAYLGVHDTVKGARDYWCKQAESAANAADRRYARGMAKKLEAYL